MTGTNKLPKEMIAGLIKMVQDIASKDGQTTNQTISIVKFYRLVMFNCTFYLNGQEEDGQEVFTNFVKVFVDYLKRILTRLKDDLLNQNIDVLYNLCLNILVALAEPKNYAMQFKQVLKLDNYGFDLAEVKYLNDCMSNFVSSADASESIIADIELDKFSKFEKEDLENQFDNKSLVDIGKLRENSDSKDINSQDLEELTDTVHRMVFQQNYASSSSQEESKAPSPSNEQDITEEIK